MRPLRRAGVEVLWPLRIRPDRDGMQDTGDRENLVYRLEFFKDVDEFSTSGPIQFLDFVDRVARVKSDPARSFARRVAFGGVNVGGSRV